jgi:DNA-directed RNA polymerase subunit L
MEDVFVKPKIVCKGGSNNEDEEDDKEVTIFVLQDESFTLMEPLIEMLQNDPRIEYTGYKMKHCLDTEVTVKIRCKSKYKGQEKESFEEALQNLLIELENVENLIANITTETEK